MNDKQPPDKPTPPTLRQMLHSVMAAAFGVNRQRNFNHDKPWHLVVLGIGFTLVFVLGLLLILRLALYFFGV